MRMPYGRFFSGRTMSDGATNLLFAIYIIGNVATFAELTFFDGYIYNWWNWIVVLPVNEALAAIWPLYWVIIRWIV